jgi:predicted MFS family arabinose efflux permease
MDARQRRLRATVRGQSGQPAAEADGVPPARPGLPRGLVWVLAASCGLIVANLYYNQPLLAVMARTFAVSDAAMGVVSALGQVGYALGLLLFVPLGDTLERRWLILVLLGAVAAALVAVAVAPGYGWLAVATLAVGALTITAQLIIPLAAGLALPQERGRVVGGVMSGLLIGILLSRTVSGYLGERLGWRGMYGIAAGLMVALALVLAVHLPQSRPSSRLSYGQLLRSLGGLIRGEPVLRKSCLFGAAAFGGFGAFWTTLPFYLAGPPYGYTSGAVGLFGLAGMAGALAAALAGRLADRISPLVPVGLGLGIALAAYGLLLVLGGHLLGLIAGVVLLDLGVQGSHISNQTRIYSLRPEIHNRLNTVYMVSFFIGGSAGSAAGGYAWSQWGWPGVCTVGLAMLTGGLIGFGFTLRRR